MAVLHGQQGQVIGSQILHPLGDIPGSHHIGVVEPKEEEKPMREEPKRWLKPIPHSVRVSRKLAF